MSVKQTIKMNAEGKIVVQVPVEFVMINDVEMTFDSIEDMRQQLNDEDVLDRMPLGDDPVYLEGSYQINQSYLDEEIAEFENQTEQERA